MHRPDHSTADPDGISAGVPGYTEGNPLGLPPVARTIVTDDQMNDTIEGLCRLVEAAGITLVKGDYDQLLEAVRFLSRLQSSYDASQDASDTPQIEMGASDVLRIGTATFPEALRLDPATSTFRLGATEAAIRLRSSTSVDVGIKAPASAGGSTYDYTLPAGGLPSVNSALVSASSGVMSHLALSAGSFTPTVSAVTGTNVDTGDFTSLSGHYQRVGNVVRFAFEGAINSTGWTSGTATFALPVAGTISGSVAAPVTCYAVAKFDELYLTNAAGNTALLLNFATSVPGTNMYFYASGSYLLT